MGARSNSRGCRHSVSLPRVFKFRHELLHELGTSRFKQQAVSFVIPAKSWTWEEQKWLRFAQIPTDSEVRFNIYIFFFFLTAGLVFSRYDFSLRYSAFNYQLGQKACKHSCYCNISVLCLLGPDGTNCARMKKPRAKQTFPNSQNNSMWETGWAGLSAQADQISLQGWVGICALHSCSQTPVIPFTARACRSWWRCLQKKVFGCCIWHRGHYGLLGLRAGAVLRMSLQGGRQPPPKHRRVLPTQSMQTG